VAFRWLSTGRYERNDRRRTYSMLRFALGAIRTGLNLTPPPNAVLASSPHLLAGLSGIALARRYRVPFVFEVRDLWPSVLMDLGAIREGSISHRALLGLERQCYRQARRIITVPPHAHRRVAELGISAQKCVHIPNATTLNNTSRRQGGALPASLRTIFEATRGRDLLIYTGAQGVSNDLHTVLNAMDLLRDTDRPTYDRLAVLLVGDGTEHQDLVKGAERRGHQHVHFHPPVDKSAIPAVLERATCLLVSFADAPTYRYGVSPNKLFDYMAAARPVLLASRLADTPVEEVDAGRSFEPGSARSLAAAIGGLLRLSEDERRAMGDRGRDLVERRYTITATGELLDRLLREVAAPAT
jgi:glycosyltransferase involved in cell wall biosynthesis